MSSKYSLNITWMYPDLMSIYGDRGNIIVLAKRCQWRNIDLNIFSFSINSPMSLLTSSDIVFMGGAQDRQQKLVSKDLTGKGEALRKLIEKGIPGLYICGAYQFLGRYYKPALGPKIPGLSIFDLHTVHFGSNTPRAIGNIAVKWQNYNLVGFENHGGRTYLGKQIKPFAKVLKGFGNNGEDGTEGAIYNHAVGSYMHGPLLSKNPELADWLIEKALVTKYQKKIKLEILDDTLEKKAHKFILKKVLG